MELSGTTFIDPAALRGRQRHQLVVSLVVPRPIGWVSSWSTDGGRNLAPFSFFNAVSSRPFLVAVSIGARGTGPKDTLENIRARGAFCVNVVTERHLEAMNVTSGEYPPEVDEFEATGLASADAARVDAPFVADCPAVLECRLYKEVELGDSPSHLILGEVVGIRLAETLRFLPDSHLVDPESLRPIGRLGGELYTLLGELRSLARPAV